MRAFTHIIFSILCIIIYVKYFSVFNLISFTVLVLFSALFVDIDEPESTIGRRLQPLSRIINSLFGHRGVFHTIFIPVALYFVLAFFQYAEIGTAILLGYLSHLAMDMITPAGIYPFYPLKWQIKGPIRTGSVFEYILAFFFIIGIIIFYTRH